MSLRSLSRDVTLIDARGGPVSRGRPASANPANRFPLNPTVTDLKLELDASHSLSLSPAALSPKPPLAATKPTSAQ